MESHNAGASPTADSLLAGAARLSHYACRLIEAEPRLKLDAGVGHAFSPDEMRATLAAAPGAMEADLARGLRDSAQASDAAADRARPGRSRDAAGSVGDHHRACRSRHNACARTPGRVFAARHGRPVGAVERARAAVARGRHGQARRRRAQRLPTSISSSPIRRKAKRSGPRPISNHEYFTRLGQQLIAALAEITADGYVFRVDMRLRPYGDSGPLAVSFDVLENYFITQGREWERYAWIKARALTGNQAAELAGPGAPVRVPPPSRLRRVRGAARPARRRSGRKWSGATSPTTSSSAPAASAKSSSSCRCSSSSAAGAIPAAAAADAHGAAAAGRAQSPAAGGGRGAGGSLRVPAQPGAPPAVPGRPADPRAAGVRLRPRAGRGGHGICAATPSCRRAERPPRTCHAPFRGHIRRVPRRRGMRWRICGRNPPTRIKRSPR